MKKHIIPCFNSEIDWEEVPSLSIEAYPWYKVGDKQDTVVKIAATQTCLYLKVRAIDCHSSASVLELNGSVYLDSCFEFFFTPLDDLSNAYINIEINCIGTLYMAVSNGDIKNCISTEQASNIKIITSLRKGGEKFPSNDDSMWQLDITIPFDFIEDFFGETIAKDLWYGNFYRCGGSIDDQYAVWNNIVADQPNYHQPLQFGQLNFAKN